MKQEQKQETKYHSRGGDFAIGFFGTIGLGLFCAMFAGPAKVGAMIVAVVFPLIGAIYSFIKGRGFIGVGILSLLAIPLLLLGACAVMLSGLH